MRRPTIKVNGKYLAPGDPRRGCVAIGSIISTIFFVIAFIVVLVVLFINGELNFGETGATNGASTKYKYHVTVIDEDGEILHDKDHKYDADSAFALSYDLEYNSRLKVVQKEGIILEMCGKRHNPAENKYWTYTVNGKDMNERPSYYFPEAGDDIVFTLEVVEP